VKAGPAATAPVAATEHDPRWRALRFLDAMRRAYPDAGPVRLPQSYADQANLPRTGFTYDAALAVLAYLAAARTERVSGRPDTGEPLLRAAQEIAGGLLHVQRHDPVHPDGPLRQAYALDPYRRAVPVVARRAGSRAGDQAWAGIALCEVYRQGGDPLVLDGARRLGVWVRDTCRSDGDLGGFRDGTAADGTPLAAVSTADNAALVALFDRLAALTGDRVWLACARHAAGFVRQMWSRGGRHFHAGSADGRSPGAAAPTVAAQALSWLALGDPRTVACLAWVLRTLRVTDTPTRPASTLPAGPRLTGIAAAPAAGAVWLEGCAQYALALRHAPGGEVPAQAQLCTPVRAQMMLGRDQTVDGRPLPEGCGVIAASSQLPVRHVGASAWLVLAAGPANPLAVHR
jgi:hypothetical protein